MTVPSSHRSVPLFGRTDLQTQHAVYGDQDCVIVKDPLALDYHRLSMTQFRVLQLLDGEISLQKLLERLHREELAFDLSLEDLQKLISELMEKNLLWNRRRKISLCTLGSDQQRGFRLFQKLVQQIYFVRLPAWNSDPILNLLLPLGRILFSPPAVVLAMFGILFSWGLLLSNFEEFQRRIPAIESLMTFQNVIVLWVAIGFAKFIHELGHGLSCVLLGGRCHGIGVAFLMFSPCLYCDVSDAWMLESRRKRILIALAGIWVELMMSAITLLLWWASAPGFFHDLCLKMFLVTSVSTILFNTNPLLKYDGYYILCDLIEVPNLQQQSQRVLMDMFQRVVSGVSPKPDPTIAHVPRIWLAAYGICSSIYKWGMVIGIGYFLHQFFEAAGLQGLSWGYIALSATAAISTLMTMILRMIRSPGWSNTMWVRCGVMGGALAGVIAGLWNCPIPDRFTAPLILEPYHVQHLYSEASGVIHSLNVQSGDSVTAGTPVLQLKNSTLEQQMIAADGLARQSAVKLQLAQATSDPDQGQLARQGMMTAALQRADAERQLQRLTVPAPTSGRVISAPDVLFASEAQTEKWTEGPRKPLEQQNVGAALQRRSHLCSIAPSDAWQAVAWVRQEECQHLQENSDVEVMLDAYPGQRISGKIERISPAGDKTVPDQLSFHSGGTLSTQRTAAGEMTEETMYQVTIALASCEQPLKTGLRGSGRFHGPQETAGEWMMRTYHRLFYIK